MARADLTNSCLVKRARFCFELLTSPPEALPAAVVFPEFFESTLIALASLV